jgi:hypothetical protein
MKRWLIAATILTLAAAGLVLWQALSDPPSIRLGVPGEWTWKYEFSPYGDRALICLVGAAMLGWLCYTTRDRLMELLDNRVPLFLLGAVALCFWLQASFAYLSRSGFGQGVFWMATPKVNVDFAEACEAESLGALLQEAQNPDRPFRIHLSTHPPGPTIFYLIQKRLWESAPDAAERFVVVAEFCLPYAGDSRVIVEKEVLGRSLSAVEAATLYSSILLLWLVVALGVVPLYFWAADLFGRATAIGAVALYALTPSFLLFNPVTDQLYAPLGMAILAMLHLGLARRDPAQLAFAGVLTWMAMQFTLAFLVVLFVFALHVGLEAYSERRVAETAKLLGWAAGAFLAVAALLLILPHRYNSFLVWKLCMAHNAGFNVGRSYLPWVAYNPADFLLFLGVPTATLFLRELAVAIRRRSEDVPWRFTVALAATILILNFSGTNRGEVARLWMFLMPMAAAVAAHALCKPEDEEGKDWRLPWAYGLLFVQAVCFKLSFDVLLPAVE